MRNSLLYAFLRLARMHILRSGIRIGLSEKKRSSMTTGKREKNKINRDVHDRLSVPDNTRSHIYTLYT